MSAVEVGAIQNLRSATQIVRSLSDAMFNVNHSIESSSDLGIWTSEMSNQYL